MKRTRQVYPTDQVIHIWAHQTQDSARNGSNVSFEGKLLYSYSTVIAQLETDANGQIWAFTSSESLTPTTAKHVNASQSATRHLHRIDTPAFSNWSRYGRTIAEMLNPLAEKLTIDLANMPRLRVRLPYAVVNYEQDRARLIECAAAFQVDIVPPPELPQELLDKAAAQHAKQDAKNAEARRITQLTLQEKQDEDRPKFDAWLTTGAGTCPASFRYANDGISNYISIKGDTVVTSLGAVAPLEHVRKAIKFYQTRAHRREIGSTHNYEVTYNPYQTNGHRVPLHNYEVTYNPYQTNGHRVPLGHFTLDSIDERGNVRAGCHRFEAAEVARFVAQWFGVLCE